MFTHIRRHQKWLWIFISAAVIISFVWYFNPNQQYGGGGASTGTGPVGFIAGEAVSQKQYADAYREAMFSHLFQYGEWPDSNSQMARQLGISLEREARNRLFLVHKLKEYDIQVDDKAVADFIAQVFQDRDTKTFQREAYDRFIAGLPQRGLKAADFQRFARRQVGIQHLAALAGTPGKLITPQEAEARFREEKQKIDTKLVQFSPSNYLAQVQANPEAVAGFYTNRAAAYRLPERLQLSYVAYPLSNYLTVAEQKLAQETNLNERIDMLYAQRGPNFYTDTNGVVMTPEAAKTRIREEAKEEFARIEARRDAIGFATELADMPYKTNSLNPAENLENLAAAKGVVSQVTEPFSQFEGPPGLNLPEQFGRMAFNLSPEEPIMAEPIVAEDGVYVIAFKKRVPSEQQPLEAIREKVTEDFKRSESFRLAREAGNAFAASVTNALAGGKTFEAAAYEAGHTVVDLVPFDTSTAEVPGLPPDLDAGSVASTARDLRPGQASQFVPARQGGYVVFLERVNPVTDEELKTELPNYVQDLQRRNAARAFDDWFRKEMQTVQISLPSDREEEAGI